jgi:hypothetical protein
MSKAAGGGSSEGQSKMVLRQMGKFQVTRLAQNKAATGFRGGNFFVRANDLSGFKGMMESFGRISLFPGFAPGIFQIFQVIGFKTAFSSRIQVFLVFVGY